MTTPTAAQFGPPVDTTPAQPPGPVTLVGRFGSVTRLDAKKHGADLWEAVRGQDHVWDYLPAGPFADAAAFNAWLAECEQHKERYFYAVLDSEGRTVGVASLIDARQTMKVIEVGYILYSPALQRTPLATEAQYLLARYSFETLGYRRYEWKCNSFNEPSKLAARRYGFVFEGVFRQHMIVKGRSRDSAWFSILDSEWPARKAAFERWLSPDNFDADGRQRVSLAALNGSKA